MEHFLQEQNNRLIISQKEFKEECWRNMEGFISPRVSSSLPKEPKSESVFKQPPGLEKGSDDRGLGAKKDPWWEKQPEQVRPKDTDSLRTERCWEGRKEIPYFSENCNNQNDPYRETNAWGETSRNEWEMPRGEGKQNDPYRNVSGWEETSRNEWEIPKGKGKGQ